jgi:hypothetical protein
MMMMMCRTCVCVGVCFDVVVYKYLCSRRLVGVEMFKGGLKDRMIGNVCMVYGVCCW